MPLQEIASPNFASLLVLNISNHSDSKSGGDSAGGGRRRRKEDFKVRKDVSVFFSKERVIKASLESWHISDPHLFLPESPLKASQNHFQDSLP